jgi:hypothetical protein
MSINNHWRNKQLGKHWCAQEQTCFDFVLQYQHLNWQWLGIKGQFYQDCRALLPMQAPYQGLIWINHGGSLSPKNLINTINCALAPGIQIAYIAINRFEIAPVNDLNLVYPDCMEESLDLIMSCCDKNLRRLYRPKQVDGRHFVGVHGLDVFVYESDH